MYCSMPDFVTLHYLPEFSQTHAHWVSDAIHPSYPLLPSFPPAFNLPQHQGFFFFFSNESPLPIIWPKFWSLSFSIRTSNEYSELISFRVDWYDILAVKGSLKSLLQHHNSKGSTLKHLAFFMFQLSHLYMTTGKKQSFDYTDLSWQSDVFLTCRLGLS